MRMPCLKKSALLGSHCRLKVRLKYWLPIDCSLTAYTVTYRSLVLKQRSMSFCTISGRNAALETMSDEPSCAEVCDRRRCSYGVTVTVPEAFESTEGHTKYKVVIEVGQFAGDVPLHYYET